MQGEHSVEIPRIHNRVFASIVKINPIYNINTNTNTKTNPSPSPKIAP